MTKIYFSQDHLQPFNFFPFFKSHWTIISGILFTLLDLCCPVQFRSRLDAFSLHFSVSGLFCLSFSTFSILLKTDTCLLHVVLFPVQVYLPSPRKCFTIYAQRVSHSPLFDNRTLISACVEYFASLFSLQDHFLSWHELFMVNFLRMGSKWSKSHPRTWQLWSTTHFLSFNPWAIKITRDLPD